MNNNDKAFNEAYLKLIKESTKSSIFDVLNVDKDGEFEVKLERQGDYDSEGTYKATLYGCINKIDDGSMLINWRVNDYNTAFGDSLGLNIQRKMEGKDKVDNEQQLENRLQELYNKFEDKFFSLNIEDFSN